MIGAIGLAMGALSTVSSLIDSATASVDKTVKAAPAPAFSPPGKAASKPSVDLNQIEPGVPIPKFDSRTHAALLALQERQHRGA